VDISITTNTVENFLLTFTSIFYEALPWVVIGAAFAGLVQELPARRAPAVMLALGLAILVVTISPLPLLPNIGLAAVASLTAGGLMLWVQPATDKIVHFLGRRRHLAITMSGFLGLVNPMCDCGVIVVMRRLLGKGLPLSCCITYILAGPIINVLVMATTFQAFARWNNAGNWVMMGLRIGLGFVVAVVTGFIVERQHRRYGDELVSPSLRVRSSLPLIENDDNGSAPSLWQRLANISETALHDFTDVIVLLIMGTLFAAAVRSGLTPERIETLSKDQPYLAIAFMIGLAFLITLCSEADAFVAANMNVQPAAQLGFLVFGPMLDLKLFFMYTRVFRPRLMWTIIFSVLIQVFLYACLVNVLWERYLPHLQAPSVSSTSAG
jgi:uncharacterized membrane protein YraQ (UPF0718 family)